MTFVGIGWILLLSDGVCCIGWSLLVSDGVCCVRVYLYLMEFVVLEFIYI